MHKNPARKQKLALCLSTKDKARGNYGKIDPSFPARLRDANKV
jgi:hypothetical protein